MTHPGSYSTGLGTKEALRKYLLNQRGKNQTSNPGLAHSEASCSFHTLPHPLLWPAKLHIQFTKVSRYVSEQTLTKQPKLKRGKDVEQWAQPCYTEDSNPETNWASVSSQASSYHCSSEKSAEGTSGSPPKRQAASNTEKKSPRNSILTFQRESRWFDIWKLSSTYLKAFCK